MYSCNLSVLFIMGEVLIKSRHENGPISVTGIPDSNPVYTIWN